MADVSSPSTPPAFPDGIPRYWTGEQVQQARAAADARGLWFYLPHEVAGMSEAECQKAVKVSLHVHEHLVMEDLDETAVREALRQQTTQPHLLAALVEAVTWKLEHPTLQDAEELADTLGANRQPEEAYEGLRVALAGRDPAFAADFPERLVSRLKLAHAEALKAMNPPEVVADEAPGAAGTLGAKLDARRQAQGKPAGAKRSRKPKAG